MKPEDFKQAVIMPDLDPEITLPSAGTYLAPLEKGLIPVELLNVPKLQIDLWRMYESNIPYIINEEYEFVVSVSQSLGDFQNVAELMLVDFYHSQSLRKIFIQDCFNAC